jgi:hypothetical protein
MGRREKMMHFFKTLMTIACPFLLGLQALFVVSLSSSSYIAAMGVYLVGLAIGYIVLGMIGFVVALLEKEMWRGYIWQLAATFVAQGLVCVAAFLWAPTVAWMFIVTIIPTPIVFAIELYSKRLSTTPRIQPSDS